jgi:SAM-dependent methyltransferase
MKTDIERQREHFNSIADKYFAARNHPNHLLLKRLIWERFFDRNSQLKTNVSTVLEPMCGMAEGYDILREHLAKELDYLGFDYSENMVDIARTRRPGLRIEWGDVSTYQATGRATDLVILIGGLHHVFSQAPSVVKNLARSIEKGGYFLNLEPTHNNWLARKVREKIYRENSLFDNDTEQGFEYPDLMNHFESAGFQKLDEVYPGLAAYILYYNPDAFPALNIGGGWLVRLLFGVDRLFWSNWVGRWLSFATITLWQKK